MTRFKAHAPYVDLVRQVSLAAPETEGWALSMVEERATPTLQLAVYHQGELALSLAAGAQEPHGQVSRQSLYVLLSCTKLYTTIVLWMLHDRGYFDFDDRIAAHWPEFGTAGKEAITMRQLLSHRAGIRLGPPGTSWSWWSNRELMARFLCGLTPEWEPGSAQGYHNRIFGFLLDHLAWRWTGKGIGELLRDEVCAPLGVEGFCLPINREQYDQCFIKILPPVRSEARPGTAPPAAQREADPQVAADAEFRPRIGDEPNLFNSFEVLQQPLAWGVACATAEAAADVMSLFALRGVHRGLRLFSQETFAEGTRSQSQPGERDRTLRVPRQWGLGPELGPFPDLACSPHLLGHGGGSTSYVFADWEHGLSVCCSISGPPGTPGGSETWRHGLAEAVLADFAV